MRKQTMEELAALYGLKLNETEPGKGGLCYEDSEGYKVPVNDIFDAADYVGLKQESNR